MIVFNHKGKTMKKNDTKKPIVADDKKVELQVQKIQTNLSNASDGKIKNLSNKMMLVEDFNQLYKMGGLRLNDFLNHFKINHLKSLDWKNKKENNIRFKKFTDLSMIQSLNTTVDEMEENEPYKYETLREISDKVIANILNDFIYYHSEIDKTGKETKSCFTVPATSKPVEIYVKSNFINQREDLKKRFNPKGIGLIALSFEKLSQFSQILLTGTSERVGSESDPVQTRSSKKLEEIKDELVQNVALLNVDFNEKDQAKLKLQKDQRNFQVDEMYQLAKSTVDKLISNAEFETVRNLILYIQQNKDFSNFIKNKYETSLNWNSNFGNQLQKVSITDLDIDNEKQINSRLKAKQ